MYVFSFDSLSIEEAADEYGDLPTIVSSVSRKGWKDGKQSSFNEDLISRDRFTSNVEMRKRLLKQQSLPDDATGPGNVPKTQKTLRESLMLAITKTKKFESLRSSLRMWKSSEQPDPEHETDDTNVSENYETDDKHIKATEEDMNTLKQKEEAHGIKERGRGEELYKQARTKRQQSADAPQGGSFRSGIVRIFQSWRSESLESGSKGSFTHKRGVAIQPIDIRGRDGNAFGLDAANRRGLFQKRRGCSSPLSPKQLDALNKESFENLSPTFRRCCMDCPGAGPTEVVLFSTDQFINKERKLSRGDNSDSSSKEGSITSDTSIDSEDSCVSVIFVPHPERKVCNIRQGYLYIHIYI